MTTPTLLCGGARLPLGDRIGRGGEGEVNAVADGSGRAVKIYLNPDAAREAKVRAIVAGGLGAVCPDVTFPLEIVRTPDGRFAGFTMRQVTGHKPIHELIATSARRQHFPKANFRFLAHVALNVARIVANVHAAGVVIGDVNASGFLVSQNGTVTLIDADSLQIGSHRCRVGMVEYTPPELQGVPFGTINRTPDHDAFGLAVMLFQILALGRHPFAGVVRGRSNQLDQAIVEGRFAYSLLRTVSATPPPGALRLEELPRAIRLLFERAFAQRLGPRPTAAEWVPALRALASNLTQCPRISNHYVATPSIPCPWCRIERATRQPIFPGGVANPASAALPSRLREEAISSMRSAKSHAHDTVTPMWSRSQTRPSKAARKVLDSESHTTLPASIRALELSLGDGRKFIDRYFAFDLAATRAVEGWRSRLGIWDIAKLADELRGHVDQLDRMHISRSSMVAQATARIASTEIKDYMTRERIESAQIVGIGPALRANLARNGITTAADVTRPALTAICNIGESRVVSLLFWREAVAVKAEDAARTAPPASGTTAAEALVDQHIRQLEHDVRTRIADLEARVARVRKSVWLIDCAVEEALVALDQASSDLTHLGLAEFARRSVKLGPTPSPPPPTKPRRKSGKKPTAKGCTRCGAPMVKRWGLPNNVKASVFFGCSNYPRCADTQSVRGKSGAP
ncbi:hypothetical protein [Sphingomonas sp. 10B4]|uniref:hypothetical protein n=1 Tax=Sphingomonas sp. 10B4 TaxID=3048575 RepID=UPI002AB40A60|nr:hypothetical protein [Sphingomonas sp. 10B4]MDY7524631.1 hypothetical protein [Sphingomonas sp. 10B4]MEB0282414.1 hypothetical protein [Sphingomonas sp. 10B4]